MCPGISLGDIRLLPRWCPAYRQHESGIRLSYGTCERVPRNIRRETGGEGGSRAAESVRDRVPSRGTRADSTGVLEKPGLIAVGVEPGRGRPGEMDAVDRKGGSACIEPSLPGKSHDIPKRLVWCAWLRVEEDGGAAGPRWRDDCAVPGEGARRPVQAVESRVAGSCFTGPVRAVEIPKKGGVRVLGIPNVIDRVAQTVIRMALEPVVDKVFHPDSYGYRPCRSPHDALRVCRERCWASDWVVDLDVKAFFDTVPWDLMLRAVAHHTDQKWILLYVERCLKSPMLKADGTLAERTAGRRRAARFHRCSPTCFCIGASIPG